MISPEKGITAMGTDAGKRLSVAVVGHEGGLGSLLTSALVELGLNAFMLSDRPGEDEVERLAAGIGPAERLDALVYASAPPEALTPAPIVDILVQSWEAALDSAFEQMFTWFQAAFPHLERSGGRIVVVQPTVGLSGAPDFSALAGLVEGQRALAKVAARQWRAKGLAVNVVGLRPDFFASELGVAELAETWSRVEQMGAGEGYSDPPIPLSVAEDLAPLVAFLASPAVRRMTGQTLILDGATWMVP
jgi:3-oxoacyl-[acyl-carrier protein] reductase